MSTVYTLSVPQPGRDLPPGMATFGIRLISSTANQAGVQMSWLIMAMCAK